MQNHQANCEIQSASGSHLQFINGLEEVFRGDRQKSFDWDLGRTEVFSLWWASDWTELILTHRGVPKEMILAIEDGWKKYNWEPIKDYLAQHACQ